MWIILFLLMADDRLVITEDQAKSSLVITEDQADQKATTAPSESDPEAELLAALSDSAPSVTPAEPRPQLWLTMSPAYCPPCDRLKEAVAAGRLNGWDIRYDSSWRPPGGYPALRFKLNGRWVKLEEDGYNEQILQKLNHDVLPRVLAEQKSSPVESAPAPEAAESSVVASVPQKTVQAPIKASVTVKGFNRAKEIDHLLDPNSPHAGKFKRVNLEAMTDWQLIDLHNREHGSRTNYSDQFDRVLNTR